MAFKIGTKVAVKRIYLRDIHKNIGPGMIGKVVQILEGNNYLVTLPVVPEGWTFEEHQLVEVDNG
jgi:ribosomal protein S19